MKRIFVTICIAAAMMASANVSASSEAISPELDSIWDRANTAYINADYTRAIVTYDSIADSGYVGEKLYYNLGNAWFKQGSMGRAILNYHRALRLDPSDSDIRHNLDVANTYVKDRIDVVPELFFVGWARDLRGIMGSNGWAVTSLVVLAIALGSVLLYLLSRRLALRKVGFYAALVAIVIGIFAVTFSVQQNNDLLRTDQAVVMSNAAPVKSSPDNSSTDLFILHEGTKVTIISSLNQWREIVIADGKKGWIHQGAIEVI